MEKIALLSNDAMLRLKLEPLVHMESVPTLLSLECSTAEDFIKLHDYAPFIGVLLDAREALRGSTLQDLEKLTTKHDLPLLLLSDRRQTSILNQKYFLQPYEILEEEMIGIMFPKILHHLKERFTLTRQLSIAHEQAQLELSTRLKLLENVSHEFRVLLNSLLLATATFEGAQAQEQQEAVKNTGAKISELLEGLGEMLKSPSDITAPLTKEFSLRDRLNKVTVAYLMRARARNIRFVRAVHTDVPDLYQGNYLKLEWILLHLLNHAFESTTEGGYVALYVHLENVDGNQVDLHFAISETADGTQPVDQHALALRRDLRRDVVSRLAEELGGRSWVDAEQNLGSTSHLICRFEKFLGTLSSARPRILLVDDNATNRLVATKMLEKMGYEVLVARDGMEAIELYRAARVELILMDIQMPIMDGLEATQKIRQIESERGQDSSNKLAIIAVTAHVSDEHREICLAAGMDGYLPKPVDFSALRELMDGFIESKN